MGTVTIWDSTRQAGGIVRHVRFRRRQTFLPVEYHEGVCLEMLEANPDAVYTEIAWLSPWLDIGARSPHRDRLSTYYGMQWVDPAWAPAQIEAARQAMHAAMGAALYGGKPLRRRVAVGVVRDPVTHRLHRRWPSGSRRPR